MALQEELGLRAGAASVVVSEEVVTSVSGSMTAEVGGTVLSTTGGNVDAFVGDTSVIADTISVAASDIEGTSSITLNSASTELFGSLDWTQGGALLASAGDSVGEASSLGATVSGGGSFEFGDSVSVSSEAALTARALGTATVFAGDVSTSVDSALSLGADDIVIQSGSDLLLKGNTGSFISLNSESPQDLRTERIELPITFDDFTASFAPTQVVGVELLTAFADHPLYLKGPTTGVIELYDEVADEWHVLWKKSHNSIGFESFTGISTDLPGKPTVSRLRLRATAQRNPTSGIFIVGSIWARKAARRTPASASLHPPPRCTRPSPVAGPLGSFSGASA